MTMDDCPRMRKAYGRCSTLLHSSAVALNPPLPNPEAVQNEIAALRNWVKDIWLIEQQRAIWRCPRPS